jgi:chorismate synthase
VWDDDAGEYRRTSALAGGLEGGMSTGEVLVAHVAMKPLATLNRPVLPTVDTATKEAKPSFKERTDVTAVPAMGVVAEAMTALVLANEALRKFGGDSMRELVRNAEGFARQVHEQATAAGPAPELDPEAAPINWDESLAFDGTDTGTDPEPEGLRS